MFDADSPFIDDRSSSVASAENNGSAIDAPHSSQSAENSQHHMPQPKKKSTQRSQVCEFTDPEKGQCKQRAIVSYKFCIRHILNDPNAPYKRCAMMAKSKKGLQKLCTNAIKIDLNQIYCSTHLIMRGEMEPKRRKNNGQAASEGSVDVAPQSNTQDSSCFGDDDHRTTISDADFADIRQSPHAFTPDNEFIMPPTSSNNYPNPLITKSPLIRTPNNASNQMLMDMSPRPILKSSANSITQHQVIVPLQQNGITTRIIPHNTSSPHLAAHLIQTSPHKPLIYNQNDLIMSEHLLQSQSESHDSPRIKIQSTDLNGHPTITLVNGQNGHYNGSPIVQRIEVTEFPTQQQKPVVRILSKKNPLEFFDNNPPLIMYDLKSVKVDDEISEKAKLKRDYMSENMVKPKKAKMIKLHQKRQKVKTEGKFRTIPNVDSMCQLVEDFDFDNTDLFPLGLEPSDDDESLSDEDVELSHLPPINVNPYDLKSSRIELYLMKKRLRRESEKLQRNAKLSMAIMQAAKSFPDSVGTAFRMREMGRKRRNLSGMNSSLQQCFYNERGNKHRCMNICVPRSSLCAQHIGYNVDQKAFVFCKTPCCGKPVSKVNSLVFNGMCEEHYLNGGKTEPTQRPTTVQRQQSSQHFTNLNNQYRPLHHRDSSITVEQLHGYGESHNENFVENQLINAISMDDFTDVVEGDVSLASVANELMFDNHALNDMLAQFPVEEPPAEDHGAADLDDSDNLLSVFSNEPPDMDQSWADISEFLRSEGYGR